MSAVRSMLFFLVVISIAVTRGVGYGDSWKGGDSMKGNEKRDSASVSIGNIRISVIYDNSSYREGFEASWGFSCLLTGVGKSILFDTGGDGSILMGNMQNLDIDPGTIDIVFLSHFHWDHTGGLESFLKKNDRVTVFSPASFAEELKKDLKGSGAIIVGISGEPVGICEGVYSTGELGTSIKEQALLVSTERGLIVITGCAHPGIVKIVEKARSIVDDDVLLVMGGFHLMRTGKEELKNIISSFREIGVRYAAPCHCSGEEAIDLFSDEYGDNFIRIGAGRILTSDDLR